MPVERREVQGMESLKVIKRSVRTVDRSPGQYSVDAGTGAGDILGTLVGAAGKAAGTYDQHLKKKIEEDKVRQMNQAFLGMQPTDDATKAGYKAHSIVGMQNLVLSETVRLKDEALSFEGTDEEWSEYVVQSRSGLQDQFSAKYPHLQDDPEALDVMTSLYNEQAPQLTNARMQGKLTQEHNKRLGEFQDAVLNRSASLEGDELAQSLNGTMDTLRRTMKLTDEEAESILVQSALEASAKGDNKLLEYTKQYKGSRDSSLFDRTGKLQKQNEAAEKQAIIDNQEGLARDKQEILDGFNAGTMSLEEFYSATGLHNDRTMNMAWSEAQIRQAVRSRQKNVAIATNLALDVKAFYDSAKEGKESFGLNATKEQKKATSAQVNKDYEARLNQALANLTPEENTTERVQAIKSQLNKEKARAFAAASMTNPQWEERFKTMLSLPFEHFADVQDLPTDVQSTVSLWNSLPEGSREAHADEKTQAFFETFESGMRKLNMTPAQSMDRALRASRSTVSIKADQREDIEAKANDVANDLLTSWMPWNGDAPETEVKRMSGVVHRMLTNSVLAGATDLDAAAERISSGLKRNSTTLDNGSMLRGTPQALSRRMGVQQEDISEALDLYMESYKEELEYEAFGVGTEGSYFDVNPDKGTFTIRASNGDILKATTLLSDIGTEAYAFREGKLEEEHKQTEASEFEAAAGMAGVSELIPDDNKVIKSDETMLQEAEKERDAREAADMEAASGMALGFGDPSAYSNGQQVTGGTAGKAQTLTASADQGFVTALKEVENSVKSGYDKATGVWVPHRSLEGGNDTLGYGHKLTDTEVKQGYVEVSGKKYKFKKDDSELTERVASKLLKQDVDAAVERLQKNWKGFDKLPMKYQRVLVSIQFNVGDTKPAVWSKLSKAIKAGDDQKVYDEMVTHYKSKGSNKYVPLQGRADVMAKALRLLAKDK